MKKHIPNGITLLNLLSGGTALVVVLYGDFVLFFIFFGICLVADYADGWAARLLRAGSPLGKELDSLADVISFGLAPGVVLYVLLATGYNGGVLPFRLVPAALPALLTPVCAALRLAKFNIDERQSENFLGLPTPAAAIFAAGLLLIHHADAFGWGAWMTQPVLLYACTGLLCGMMVSEIPMFSLKFKHFRWGGNEIKYIFAGMAVLLLFMLREAGPAAVILLYILLSIFRHLLKRNA